MYNTVFVMTSANGWIYVVSCDMYDKEGLLKIGFTAIQTPLDKEVEHALKKRYATTLISPRVQKLLYVHSPRQAERFLFERIKSYRYSHELFKIQYSELEPHLIVTLNDFSPHTPFYMRHEVLEKNLKAFRKKIPKWSKNAQECTEFVNGVFDVINGRRGDKVNLSQQNMSCLNQLQSFRCCGDINKLQQQIRGSELKFVFESNNWDRRDKNLPLFFKNVLIRI